MTKTSLIKMDVENAFGSYKHDLIDTRCHPNIDFLYFYCNFRSVHHSSYIWVNDNTDATS